MIAGASSVTKSWIHGGMSSRKICGERHRVLSRLTAGMTVGLLSRRRSDEHRIEHEAHLVDRLADNAKLARDQDELCAEERRRLVLA